MSTTVQRAHRRVRWCRVPPRLQARL